MMRMNANDREPPMTFVRLFFVYLSFLVVFLPVGAHQHAPRNVTKPITHPYGKKKAQWTLVNIMQASNDLESFAYRNIREMMRWGSNEHVNILVDFHKAGDKSWRYRIEKGYCSVEEVCPRSKNASIAEEIKATMRWAIQEYPAERYALILSNHGLGCIDVATDDVGPSGHSFRAGQRGISEAAEEEGELVTRATRNLIPSDRGILFDDERRISLSNTELHDTLQTISTQMLGGRKMDLVGMDACLMGMIEIACQVEPYAHYFVASEEFEFAQGWAYGDIFEALLANPTMDARGLGCLITKTFERSYAPRTSYYTLSCIHLDQLKDLATNLDDLAHAILYCKRIDAHRMRLFVQQARCQALSFSLPDFLDIQSFYKELLKLVMSALDQSKIQAIPMPKIGAELFLRLKAILCQGLEVMKGCVVSNVVGRYLTHAGGLSIYFPQRGMESSYFATHFAQSTAWPHFVQDHMINR